MLMAGLSLRHLLPHSSQPSGVASLLGPSPCLLELWNQPGWIQEDELAALAGAVHHLDLHLQADPAGVRLIKIICG